MLTEEAEINSWETPRKVRVAEQQSLWGHCGQGQLRARFRPVRLEPAMMFLCQGFLDSVCTDFVTPAPVRATKP